MRADDGDGDFVRRGRGRNRRRAAAAAMPSAPSGSPVSAWNARPMEASSASWPPGASSVMPNGMPSGAHRGRHRKPAQIEQVDEVGVGAEPAVELDRVGQHLLDGVDRRRGRQQQRIDAAGTPRRGRGAALPACRRPRTRRRRSAARPCRMISWVTGWIESGDDASSDLQHDVALRHPRPFVEQPRGLVERLDVDLDDLRAERGRARHRRVVGAGRGAIAEEHALAGDRHAEPHALRE